MRVPTAHNGEGQAKPRITGRCGCVLTSPSSNEATSVPLDNPQKNLIRRALRLTGGKRRSTAREQALADLVASTEVALGEARRQASIGGRRNETPLPICQVMRAPKGRDRLVVLYYDGMIIKAMLHPLGRRNPVREAAVWRCLRDNAINVREQRK